MTTEKQQQLEQVELTIEQAQDNIAHKQALTRLYENADFRKIILEGYLQKEAARMVHAKAEPSLQSESDQLQLTRMIDGLGYFRQYLNKVYQFGAIAEKTIESHRQTRTDLMGEAD